MASSPFPVDPGLDDSPDFNERPAQDLDRERLIQGFRLVRSTTEHLARNLSAEDQNLQSMEEASPVKWHRAHTSWFFETFLLCAHLADYRVYDKQFAYLFNSYYNGVGQQYPRARRGLISRPDVPTVERYRNHVDQSMVKLIDSCDRRDLPTIASLILLGLNHEQQHQELLVTDLKHAFSFNPAHPTWVQSEDCGKSPIAQSWVDHEGGLEEFGHTGDTFCFDNETPGHKVFVNPFQLARRPVTCGEYLAFLDDDGYQRSELWLADGWAWIEQESIASPLYWWQEGSDWYHYTLGGALPINPAAPVCHLSFYEAWAYAQWANARLPSEAEWELAANRVAASGHFADRNRFHPEVASGEGEFLQMFGDVWEWTSSSYAPYPGFKPAAGAIGEYNGKFMANQMVLRGGSCATPAGHIRPTYRNFFYPKDRWQFSGLRLARDL